jgi:two-component system sensor histidine kinase DegS
MVDEPGVPARAAAEARAQVEQLEGELSEIALLEQAARGEATRHEQRRTQAADRLAALQGRPDADPAEVREVTSQLVTLTGRAAIMQAQVEILEGKQRALTRFRDSLGRLANALAPAGDADTADGIAGDAGVGSGPAPWPAEGGAPARAAGAVVAGVAGPADTATVPPGVARAVLSAQEDLRREIARAMHDGPAQSLTNIVLQAQIVQRLAGREPELSVAEAATLVDMVQRTLDATKTFIFDVRPMVLDDLGLLPTLRRAAMERGRRARVPVSFDSIGADRRLPSDLESAAFRILDEAMTGYLSTSPTRLDVQLDWSDEGLHALLTAVHPPEPEEAVDEEPVPIEEPAGRGRRGKGEATTGEILPQLAAMIEEQREGDIALRSAAAEALAQRRALPAGSWQEIQQRAASAGIEVALGDDGRHLDVRVGVPPTGT